jgi:hypothetical protein
VLAQHHGVGLNCAELRKHSLGSLLEWLSKINCWNTKNCGVGITLRDSHVCASSSVSNSRRAVQSRRPAGAVASDQYIFGFEVQDGTDVCVGFRCNSNKAFSLEYSFFDGQLRSGLDSAHMKMLIPCAGAKEPYRPAVGDTVWFSLNVESQTCSIHILRKPKSFADKMIFAVPFSCEDDSNVVTLLKSQFGVSHCGFVTVAQDIPLHCNEDHQKSSQVFWPTASFVGARSSVLLLWCSFVDNYISAT